MLHLFSDERERLTRSVKDVNTWNTTSNFFVTKKNNARIDVKNDVKNELETVVGIPTETAKTEDSTAPETTKDDAVVNAEVQAKAQAMAPDFVIASP